MPGLGPWGETVLNNRLCKLRRYQVTSPSFLVFPRCSTAVLLASQIQNSCCSLALKNRSRSISQTSWMAKEAHASPWQSQMWALGLSWMQTLPYRSPFKYCGISLTGCLIRCYQHQLLHSAPRRSLHHQWQKMVDLRCGPLIQPHQDTSCLTSSPFLPRGQWSQDQVLLLPGSHWPRWTQAPAAQCGHCALWCPRGQDCAWPECVRLRRCTAWVNTLNILIFTQKFDKWDGNISVNTHISGQMHKEAKSDGANELIKFKMEFTEKIQVFSG